VLSGQALTFSDVVGELEVIQREFRAGVGALPVLSAKWLVFSVLAIAQAGLITAVFCAFPRRAPQRFVAFGPELDLFLGLAALSVAAMTLGMFVSTLAAKLEHAVAIVTLTTITQIALNGVTSGLSGSSLTAAVAVLLPDRWGLAAAASSVDLLGIDNRPPAAVSPDGLWRHSTGQWLWDLGVLLALSAVFFGLAVWRLHSRLKPKKVRHRWLSALRLRFPAPRRRRLPA
jgi:ABC transport system ATP-binding/permease protein